MKGAEGLKRRNKLIIGIFILAAAVNPALAFEIIAKLLKVFRPIIIGMAAAFVMNRPICVIYKLYEKMSEKAVSRNWRSTVLGSITRFGSRSKDCRHKRSWIISVTVGYLLLAAAVCAAVGIIIPQTIESVKLLAANSNFYFERIDYFYNELIQKERFGIIPALGSLIEKAGEKLPEIAAGFYGKTAEIVGVIIDIFIGVIISIYILVSKDKLRVIVRGISRKILSKQAYDKYARLYYTVYDVFSRFVSGQVTEAAVLGVLCYIGMKLFRFDYALLISFIIGITALLPVVGAIIGTVPCAFLLFLSEPMSAVWFILFIIVLQQLENNFIYPKVVGKSMGLPPLPVLIAILVGAKFGGCVGILLAVPITSVIFGIVKEKLEES